MYVLKKQDKPWGKCVRVKVHRRNLLLFSKLQGATLIKLMLMTQGARNYYNDETQR